MRFLQKNFKILLFRKRHSKTFLEHIKPIFILGKIYGCIFFDLDKKPLLTNILISAPIPLAYIFSCIDCWFVHTVLPTIPSSKYQLVSDSLFVVGCTVNAILQSYNYFVKRGQHKEFFLDAQKTNEILGVGIRYGINYSFIYFTALLSVLTTSLVVIGYYSPMITFDFTHIAYVIIHVQALLVSEFISFTLLREVRRQFAVINEKLWIIIERIDLKDESVVETDQLLAQHKRLCKYCLEFNSFLGVTLLIDFAVNIVMMVQGTHFVFFVIINLVDGKNVDVYVGFVRCIKMLLGWVIVVLKLLSWIGVQKEVCLTSCMFVKIKINN